MRQQKLLWVTNNLNNGHIFYKEIQLLAYADDIHIKSRSESDLRKFFESRVTSGKTMEWSINQYKTKYMLVGNDTCDAFFQIQV